MSGSQLCQCQFPDLVITGFTTPLITAGTNNGTTISGFSIGGLPITQTGALPSQQYKSVIGSNWVNTFIYSNMLTIIESEESLQIVYQGNIIISGGIDAMPAALQQFLSIVSINGNITVDQGIFIDAKEIVIMANNGTFTNFGTLNNNTGSTNDIPNNIVIQAQSVPFFGGTITPQVGGSVLINNLFLFGEGSTAFSPDMLECGGNILYVTAISSSNVSYMINGNTTTTTGLIIVDNMTLGNVDINGGVVSIVYAGTICVARDFTVGGGTIVKLIAGCDLMFVDSSGNLHNFFNYNITPSGNAGDVILIAGGEIQVNGIAVNASGTSGNVFLYSGSNIYMESVNNAGATPGNVYAIGTNVIMNADSQGNSCNLIATENLTISNPGNYLTAIAYSILNFGLANNYTVAVSAGVSLSIPPGAQNLSAIALVCLNNHFFAGILQPPTAIQTVEYVNGTPTSYGNSLLQFSNNEISLPVVFAPLSVILYGPSEVTVGNAITLTAEGEGGAGTYTYQWSGLGTGTTVPFTKTDAALSDTGVYTVTVTDVLGKMASNSIYVSVVLPVFQVNISGMTTVEIGDTLTLKANTTGGSGNYSYSWTGPNSVTSTASTLNLPNVTLTDAGAYKVVVTDTSNNKMVNATANVVVLKEPALFVSIVGSTVLTAGASITLQANAVGGSGTYTQYQWDNEEETSVILSTTSSLVVTVAGSYSVQVTDSQGAIASSTIHITLFEMPSSNSATSVPVSKADIITWTFLGIAVFLGILGLIAFYQLYRDQKTTHFKK